METERKLDVLADIARALNQSGVTWAVGGSLLLYFKGKTGVFRDIDLMVCETDVEKLDCFFGPASMLPLAVATSIDALAVGVTFAFLQVNIFWAVLFIGVVTFVLSAIGVRVGHVFGAKYKSKAELAGGLILILMGTKILLEHLGIL